MVWEGNKLSFSLSFSHGRNSTLLGVCLWACVSGSAACKRQRKNPFPRKEDSDVEQNRGRHWDDNERSMKPWGCWGGGKGGCSFPAVA